MSALARIRRQFRHHYGSEELIGSITEMDPSQGTCTLATIDESLRTLWLGHLAELMDSAEGIDYLKMARNRGWNGH